MRGPFGHREVTVDQQERQAGTKMRGLQPLSCGVFVVYFILGCAGASWPRGFPSLREQAHAPAAVGVTPLRGLSWGGLWGAWPQSFQCAALAFPRHVGSSRTLE